MVYKTEQRMQLYHFFQNHPHEFFTVKQIEEALTATGSEISISAIYRNLSCLAKDGVIKKTIQKNSRETSYRYIGSSQCRDKIHMNCTVCGKIFHMDQDLAEILQAQLINRSDFLLDKNKTVLYGVCKDCQKNRE